MKLQRKLTLVAGLVITVVGVSVGVAAVSSSYFNEIAKIDQRLNANATILGKSLDRALSTALLLGNQSDIPTSVSYVSESGELTNLVENEFLLSKTPSRAELLNSNQQIVATLANEPGRIRSVKIGDGEYVIFAASTAQVIAQRNAQVRWFVIALLIALGVGILAINRLIKRDVRQIELLAANSTLIATGKTDTELPDSHGNSEVDELTKSMKVMVSNLLNAIDREKQSHLAMQNFLSDASHELRTPLTAIRGYAEIVAGSVESPTDQQQRAFTRIASEVMRMDKLIDDLLLLAKLGEFPRVEFTAVNMSELLAEQLADLVSFQPNRLVHSSVHPKTLVFGSNELLRVLVNNLFSNLRRHTNEDVHVQVSLEESDGFAVLKIADAGPGLPQKFYTSQETIPFERFDESRSRVSGGAGLGLSIIKAVVDAHTGTLVFQRSELGGHETLIKLPIAKDI
ncbi:MAG: sensor histidine kinase [Actinobacteria bacterium]|nr:sensor histidine kinase [Actinomycetota bacterium]NBY15475.1 sensor histidine kinase [Actinomycetota bacterium]